MLKIAAIGLVLATAASATHAADISGTAVGNWINPNATQGFGIFNYDTGNVLYEHSYAVWGYTNNCSTCTSFNNFWAFDGVGSDGDPEWSAEIGETFHFGDLSYRNGSVYGHDFEGASLSIDLAISAPVSIVETFNFDLEVENVPNTTGNAVTDGDIARIIGSVSDQYFSFGNDDYTLELMGFSRDNGVTLASEFQVAEATLDTVGLYGRVTRVGLAGGPVVHVSSVPVPAAGLLLGTALAGFSLMRRKRFG